MRGDEKIVGGHIWSLIVVVVMR